MLGNEVKGVPEIAWVIVNELAARMGADQFVNAARSDPVHEVRRLTDNEGKVAARAVVLL
jgi:hypothetical protein